ncbi:MAG: Sir2 family NAD-dependent protein deacetylase [Pseudomonadota bacterium]|nr:Sir2 family NAD-dependent protein deacetylase [Pseudomonadota bacterium]
MDKYKRIVFFTGAGISVESGIPTYRGVGGVWKDYNYQDYACQEAFSRNPEKVWDFHDRRRALIKSCEPKLAHRIIAKIQHQQSKTCIILFQRCLRDSASQDLSTLFPEFAEA